MLFIGESDREKSGREYGSCEIYSSCAPLPACSLRFHTHMHTHACTHTHIHTSTHHTDTHLLKYTPPHSRLLVGTDDRFYAMRCDAMRWRAGSIRQPRGQQGPLQQCARVVWRKRSGRKQNIQISVSSLQLLLSSQRKLS